MKKILLLIVLGSLITGCRHINIGPGVIGSGVRKSEKRDVGTFKSILTDGAFEIEVVVAPTQSLLVEGDDNVLPLVRTDVAGDVLHITNHSSYSTKNGVKIKISVPDIGGVTANGAGTIKIDGIKNDKFVINANGAPTIRVTGETKNIRIEANGAGTVDTDKLRATNADVETNGVSKVEVFASDVLNVTVSGPSTVIYDGDPNVSQTVNGPGSVQKKHSGGA